MIRKLLSIGVFLALIFAGSCDIEPDENFQFTALEVISADVPEFFELTQQHDIEITYRRPDACTFFHDFDISAESSTERNIFVIGSSLIQNDCNETSSEGNAVLRFTAIENVTYTFRFYTGVDENGEPIFLEYIVPVR